MGRARGLVAGAAVRVRPANGKTKQQQRRKRPASFSIIRHLLGETEVPGEPGPPPCSIPPVTSGKRGNGEVLFQVCHRREMEALFQKNETLFSMAGSHSGFLPSGRPPPPE